MLTISVLVEFIESIFGRGNLSRNNNFDVRCPICNPLDSSKKKLSILLPSCKVHCWVCGFKSRTLIPLIRKFGTQSQLHRYRELLGSSEDSNTLITGEQDAKNDLVLPRDFRLLVNSSITDPDVKAAWRYLVDRGLSERDAWYFKLGLSNEMRWKRRIIIPSFDSHGKLNYYTARAIDKGKKPKYDSPEVDKHSIIFNELNIDWSKPLVLVEGPFDITKCPDNTTALLGSDLSEHHELFNRILLHDTPIYLAMDGDMWDTKMPKIYKKLSEYDVDVKAVDVRPWGDPGSMTKCQITSALSNASSITWEDDFSRRLKRAVDLRSNL